MTSSMTLGNGKPVLGDTYMHTYMYLRRGPLYSFLQEFHFDNWFWITVKIETLRSV